MSARQTIAIIGSCTEKGKIAAKKLAKSSLRLLLSDDQKDCLSQLKEEIGDDGAEIVVEECIQEAGWEADIIVLALDWQQEVDIFTRIKPFITGKIVISFSKDNNCLLPYSKVIAISDADPDWVNKIESEIKTALLNK